MFGYVRPDGETEADRAHFSAAYCGLCRVLGMRYGPIARLILSYDLTFLAVLLWPPGELPTPAQKSCLAHPLRKRACFPENPALDLAADYSVILSWQQIQDKLEDPGGKKRKFQGAERLLRPACQRAEAVRPDFARTVRVHLDELHALEAHRCPTLDEPAHAFAQILSGAAGEVAETAHRRILEQILYHLGRWIYLVDAADDLMEDFRTGSYNPLLYRYSLPDGRLTEDAKKSLAGTLDHSIRLMAAAFELWDFGAWSGVIRSVLYRGLFAVGGAVLEGRFHAADHAADWPRAGSNGQQRAGTGRNEEQL